MQPRLTVGILVLQAEGLVCAIRYLGFLFQTAPTGVVAEPNQVAYWSSLSECRFGRSGSSGFAVCFLRLHWSSCVLVPTVRRNPDRCRYRYICRPVGLPARGGCRPKRIRFLLRGRLKLLRFSDGLCLSFCPRRRRCRPKSLSCRLF